MIRSTVNGSIISASKANAITAANGESLELIKNGITESEAVNIEANGSTALAAFHTTLYSNGHNGASE